MSKRIASLAIAVMAVLALSLPANARGIVDPMPPRRPVTSAQKAGLSARQWMKLGPMSHAEVEKMRRKAQRPEANHRPLPPQWATSQAYI